MNESGTGGWGAPAPDHERDYEPIQPGSGRAGSWRERLKRFFGPIAAGLALLATKGKAIILLLPKLKIFTTSGSMLVSVAAYAWIWGWAFAVGFVLLLLLHELGHVIQLRREGVEASAPMFIPFLGAVIAAKSMGDDAAAEARVGLAGPILGSIASLVPLAIWLATGEEFWQALAYVGFFLNLFNLVPIVPLDGGRAAAALHPAFWFVGLLLMVGLVILRPNPILILIVVVGGLDLWRRWRERGQAAEYYRVSTWHRTVVGVVYLGLAGILALAMSATYVERDL